MNGCDVSFSGTVAGVVGQWCRELEMQVSVRPAVGGVPGISNCDGKNHVDGL